MSFGYRPASRGGGVGWPGQGWQKFRPFTTIYEFDVRAGPLSCEECAKSCTVTAWTFNSLTTLVNSRTTDAEGALQTTQYEDSISQRYTLLQK